MFSHFTTQQSFWNNFLLRPSQPAWMSPFLTNNTLHIRKPSITYKVRIFFEFSLSPTPKCHRSHFESSPLMQCNSGISCSVHNWSNTDNKQNAKNKQICIDHVAAVVTLRQCAQWSLSRVAKCHRYGRYICVKILAQKTVSPPPPTVYFNPP